MIMLDRKNARSPNGLVFGTPGGGKSFSCKREMIGVLLKTHDHVLVCDPEGEYAPLVKLLHGQIIKLSPTSRDYLNPLDINLNYSEDENPLALKSDFVLSLCELIMGGKTGLEAIERTVIDRAVQRIYQPYFADPRPENMPILSDLHAALTAQHLPEADRVAQALDLYVSGSLNFFNNQTTVDIDNRFVCFDIKELPKNLKKPGMLIVHDAVWNTVTVNRSIGRATWYFVDEFHLLLKEEQTGDLEAFQKMGRCADRCDAERQGSAVQPGNRKYSGKFRLHLYAQPSGGRPQNSCRTSEYLAGAAKVRYQLSPRRRTAVL